MNKERVLVFGAAGHVGRAVITDLLERGGKQVLAVCHDITQAAGLAQIFCRYYRKLERTHHLDVLNFLELERLASFLRTVEGPEGKPRLFDGLVYAIGHCPPGGFAQTLGLSKAGLNEQILANFYRQCLGLLNVFQTFLPLMAPRGRMVVVGSNPDSLPLSISPAMSAQAEVAKGLRCELLAQGSDVILRHLQFGPLDTKYYQGGPPELAVRKPISLISPERVVAEVGEALDEKDVSIGQLTKTFLA